MASKKATTPQQAKPVQGDDSKKALAIVGLVVNIMIFTGIGSLIGGKIKEGVWQLVLIFVGILFSLTIIGLIIGIPMIFAAWIWGIFTGVELVKEAF